MKKLLLFLAVIFLILSAKSQDWQLLNPLPQSQSLNAINFPDSLTGYFVGDHGTIMKTTDGGNNFKIIKNLPDYKFLSVYFTDINIGYAIDNYHSILKTTTGGSYWDTILIDFPLKSLVFADSLTGLASGDNLYIRTSDGGISWTSLPDSLHFYYNRSICFIKSSLGYAVGISGFTRTTDGGLTWTLLSPVGGNCISFSDSTTGYMIANDESIRKTADGGISWTTFKKYDGHRYKLIDICNNGIFILRENKLFRTFNEGLSWDSIYFESSGDFYDICFTSGNKGFISGYGGTIIKTMDGGFTWEYVTQGTTKDLYSVTFKDKMKGIAVGAGSTMLKTSDGGINWTESHIEPEGKLLNISFNRSDTGYIIGDAAIFLRTTDFGQTWSPVSGFDTNFSPMHIYLLDSSIGFLYGKSSTFRHELLYKTVDAGELWEIVFFSVFYDVTRVFFTSESTGFLAGGYIDFIHNGGIRYIVRTIDGGSYWDWVDIGNPYDCNLINAFFFTSSDTGYTAGGSWKCCDANDLCPHGAIDQTVDGGKSWYTIYTIDNPLFSITFTDKKTGYAVGGNGTLLKTTDAGVTWDLIQIPTRNTLNSIFVADPQTLYCVGEKGTIIKMTSAGTGIPTLSFPENNISVYPNPTTGKINLSGTIGATLSVTDLNGQTILNFYNFSGTTLDLSSYPKGLYVLNVNFPGKNPVHKKIVII